MFECHITLNPTADPTVLERRITLADEYGWKVSHIDGDPLLGDSVYTYFTCHSSSLDKIRWGMNQMAMRLGDEVVRTKIEEIVWDSRFPNGQ